MSPRYSRARSTWLLTVTEALRVFNVSESTIKRLLKKNPVYTETHSESRGDGKGGTRVKYLDPYTLGLPVPADPLSLLGGSPEKVIDTSEVQPKAKASGTLEVVHQRPIDALLAGSATLTLSAPSEVQLAGIAATTGPVVVGDLEAAQALHQELLPVLRQKQGTRQRREALDAVAAQKGVHSRTVRRWVTAFEETGLVGLSRMLGSLPRADKGTHRLPVELVQVVQSVWVSNPRTISARKVHQIVVNAVPELAAVERKNGRVVQVSVPTVQSIRDEMLADPTLRLLFADADALKEYRRTWSGQVLAAHGNDLWQMDMTRCDIMVYDPELDRIYRPRVQAVIDTYSGCIMGIAFSQRENQDQADLVLARAIKRKIGPLEKIWPLFGLPNRLYIDNGKTYKSEHFHRIVRGLGVEIIHSRPRVSHTRGAIERFFGTLHWLEKALVGYCGKDAAHRSNEQLKVLYHNTLRQAREGKKVAQHERLLTLQEYQEAVLKWLVTDYHQTVEHGQTRLEHFTSTVPNNRLVELDPAELMILFARWTERVVSGNGVVMLDKVAYTLPDGKLAQYQGQTVQVLAEPFALGDPARGVMWQDRRGQYHLLGNLIQAPTAADSLEAAAQRRANRAATKEQVDLATGLRTELFNPAATYNAHLNRQMAEVVVQPALPAARGRLAAVNPEVPSRPDLGDFGKSFLRPADDLDALLREIREENE